MSSQSTDTSITSRLDSMDIHRTTPEHRKQAFSQIGNHLSWPTPPTEIDHDFPTSYTIYDNMSEKEKSLRTLLDVDAADVTGIEQQRPGIAPLHSPPASPVQGYRGLLPPIQTPSHSIDHQQLPPLSDTQLFSEPRNDTHHLPLFAKESTEDARADSLSPAGRQPTPEGIAKAKLTPAEPAARPECTWKGLYSIFPHFQSVDRDFFRRYRQSCYSDVKRMPAWRPVNIELAQPSDAHWGSALAPARTRNNRVSKPRDKSPPASRPAAVLRKKAAAPRVASALAPVTKAKAEKRERERQSASIEPAARKRAPPSKAVIVDDWQQITDYSPPANTTLGDDNRLRVSWKGVANDLSADPDIQHLHEQEVEVAQTLKLPASQYLANKRRIFEARLKSIKERKNFTKTAAQQACNIDVNKTSQLYEAYTRVGWFDEVHFQRFLT